MLGLRAAGVMQADAVAGARQLHGQQPAHQASAEHCDGLGVVEAGKKGMHACPGARKSHLKSGGAKQRVPVPKTSRAGRLSDLARVQGYFAAALCRRHPCFVRGGDYSIGVAATAAGACMPLALAQTGADGWHWRLRV
ncbi:hypothetical protein MASR1M59_24030 [Melaminivora sp.]